MLGGITEALSGLWGGTDKAVGGRGLPRSMEPARQPTPRRPVVGLVYTPGQPIVRSLPLDAAAAGFVRWMCEFGFVGEYTWSDIWDFYSGWHCADEKLVPVPPNRKAYFAQELAKLCERGQVRVLQQGRVRRLRTYKIVATDQVRIVRAA
jgi:hypothetical protein